LQELLLFAAPWASQTQWLSEAPSDLADMDAQSKMRESLKEALDQTPRGGAAGFFVNWVRPAHRVSFRFHEPGRLSGMALSGKTFRPALIASLRCVSWVSHSLS
jgi:hypothetical protein